MCVSRYRFMCSAFLAENLSCRKFQESEYTVNDIFVPLKTKRGYQTAAQRYEFYFRVVKYWFLPRENEIHIFKLPCYFLFIKQTSIFAQKTMKKRKMTSSIPPLVRIWKIRHSSPGCSFVQTLRESNEWPIFHYNTLVYIIIGINMPLIYFKLQVNKNASLQFSRLFLFVSMFSSSHHVFYVHKPYPK